MSCTSDIQRGTGAALPPSTQRPRSVRRSDSDPILAVSRSSRRAAVVIQEVQACGRMPYRDDPAILPGRIRFDSGERGQRPHRLLSVRRWVVEPPGVSGSRSEILPDLGCGGLWPLSRFRSKRWLAICSLHPVDRRLSPRSHVYHGTSAIWSGARVVRA